MIVGRLSIVPLVLVQDMMYDDRYKYDDLINNEMGVFNFKETLNHFFS